MSVAQELERISSYWSRYATEFESAVVLILAFGFLGIWLVLFLIYGRLDEIARYSKRLWIIKRLYYDGQG